MVEELDRQRQKIEELRRQTQDLLKQARRAMDVWQAAIDDVEGITAEAQRTLAASQKLIEALENHAGLNVERTRR